MGWRRQEQGDPTQLSSSRALFATAQSQVCQPARRMLEVTADTWQSRSPHLSSKAWSAIRNIIMISPFYRYSLYPMYIFLSRHRHVPTRHFRVLAHLAHFSAHIDAFGHGSRSFGVHKGFSFLPTSANSRVVELQRTSSANN
jgi:hypothetical protein